MAGDELVVGCGSDGDGGGGDQDDAFGAGVVTPDAEVVESAGLAQGEFAAVIDGVVTDAEVLRWVRWPVGWLWAGRGVVRGGEAFLT